MGVPQGLCALLVVFLMSLEDSEVWASQDITITPAYPLVKLSSSVTLNCSGSCLPGKPRWNMGTESISALIVDQDQYSILNISHVSVDNNKFKCTCDKKQSLAELYYFSDLKISTDPEKPVSGQQFQLKCSVDVHPNVMVDLKLLREETVIHTQTQCVSKEDDNLFKHCEFSATESTESTQVHYQCEATLQVKTSQLNESASLLLKLKEYLPQSNSTAGPNSEEYLPQSNSTAGPNSKEYLPQSNSTTRRNSEEYRTQSNSTAGPKSKVSGSSQAVIIGVVIVVTFMVLLGAAAFVIYRKCKTPSLECS